MIKSVQQSNFTKFLKQLPYVMNKHKKSAGSVVYYLIEGSAKPNTTIIEQQPALVRYDTTPFLKLKKA